MIRTPIHPEIRKLISTYPAPEDLLAAIGHANRVELEAIARLWLTEGIPAAFSACPMEFEHIRCLIAGDLGVPARAINMTGSARLGYSLSPKKFPRGLTESSDLDIFVVDHALFDGCLGAAERWRKDVAEGVVTARNENEAGHWEAILGRVDSWRQKGYCDPKYILERDAYEPVPRIRKAMRRAMHELKALKQPRLVSARIYRDWGRAFRKLCFDLRQLQKQLVTPATC